MIFIHKNDSTVFADQDKFLTFHIKTDLDLTGWKAEFVLCSVKKIIENISTKTFDVILSSKDTSKLYYGNPCGELRLIDKKGNIKTIANNIPFCVTNEIVENESQVIDLDIPESAEIQISVSYQAPAADGTTNYEELENKPSINGVELTGDKSLDELGIQPKGDYLKAGDIPQVDLSGLAKDSEVVHLSNEETITGAKTFTKALKIQNGDGTGSLIIGGDVNAGTITNGTRKLARVSVPTYADKNLFATLLGFDSNGDDVLSVKNRKYDAISFGGQTKITNATSPMSIAFCVTKTRNSTAAVDKVYPLEMDSTEARFNVVPNYNGVNLATVNEIPQIQLTTQSDYDNLATKEANTLYLIEE